jgi:hypothetical protein
MMATSPDPSSIAGTPPRRQWWIPVSVRLLIALGITFGASVGVRNYDQHRALQAIYRLGGTADVELSSPQWLSAWIADHRLGGFGRVTMLDVSGKQLTADSVEELLASLGDIEELHVDGHSLTRRNLERLAKLEHLKALSISGPMADESLKALPELPRLEALALEGDHISDSALRGLQKYRALHILFLETRNVTSKGLDVLASFGNLKEMQLENVRLSEEDWRRFNARHPDLRVRRTILTGGCGPGRGIRYVYRDQLVGLTPQPASDAD